MSEHDSEIAVQLADWASVFKPTDDDLCLADRSLRDTLAVTLAARGHAIERVSSVLDDATRWATLGHVLDYDDVHLDSTTHLSIVCVMAALAAGGDARAYLAGGGVMARLGSVLGWCHYESGWHATCTAGAPAAAVAAGIAMGLDHNELAIAMALAIPGAGGVQQAFGTDGKSLQVGFAVAAGVRAAHLARLGASGDPRAVDEWIRRVSGSGARPDLSGPAIPGGLAIKLFPCCYALQRPIVATQQAVAGGVDAAHVVSVRVVTAEAALQPLIHHRPWTGLEGKFSLEYAVAAALLDPHPGFASFSDSAVQRPRAQEIVKAVEICPESGGESILAGSTRIEITLTDGSTVSSELVVPPGAPSRPPTVVELDAKIADCGPDVPGLLEGIDWSSAKALLSSELGDRASELRSRVRIAALSA